MHNAIVPSWFSSRRVHVKGVGSNPELKAKVESQSLLTREKARKMCGRKRTRGGDDREEEEDGKKGKGLFRAVRPRKQ